MCNIFRFMKCATYYVSNIKMFTIMRNFQYFKFYFIIDVLLCLIPNSLILHRKKTKTY